MGIRAVRMTSLPLALAMLAIAGVSAATDPRAALKAVVDSIRGTTMRATVTLSVQRPGQETRYVLAIVSDGQDRSLVQVKAPARDAGQAFLLSGENLWIYSPRLKRALRLPPSGRSESFLGSDISYNDLGGRDLEQDYTPRMQAEDQASFTLELTPKPQAPTPYGKVILKANAQTSAPLEFVFYDQRGQAVKKVTFSEYVKASDRLFPTRIAIDDLLRTGNRTFAVYSEYQFGITIPGACFTLQALESGC